MMDIFNGALTLNQTLLRGLRESPDVVRRGMLVVLLVGLLVGGVRGISNLLTTSDPDRMIAALDQQIDDALSQQGLGASSPEQRAVLTIFEENKEAFLALVRNLATLPTTLPQPLGAILVALGTLVSTPLSYLSGLLIAVFFTHIAALQLGGQGTLQQMLGLGALSVAPHALDALGFIPVLGPTIGLIAWAWGLVVLVVATSVAHRLDSGKATIAVLLYPLVFTLLLMLGCCVLFGLTLLGGQA